MNCITVQVFRSACFFGTIMQVPKFIKSAVIQTLMSLLLHFKEKFPNLIQKPNGEDPPTEITTV